MACTSNSEDVCRAVEKIDKIESSSDNFDLVGLKKRILSIEARLRNLLVFRDGMSLPTNAVATTYELSELLSKSGESIAPMRVLPCSLIEKHLSNNTMAQLSYKDTIDVWKIGQNGRVIFVSHRWFACLQAQPDRLPDWPKARMLVQDIAQRCCEDLDCQREDIFFWWDIVSVNQDDYAARTFQMECTPIYVAMSDALVAARSGDDTYTAKPPEKFAEGIPSSPKNNKKWLGSLAEHPGHYNNRFWTKSELYMATSDFQRKLRGAPMEIYTVLLSRTSNLLRGPYKQAALLRPLFLNDFLTFVTPFKKNVADSKDAGVLEAMMCALNTPTIPKLVAAATLGLPMALEVFIEAKADVNGKATTTGITALHAATSRFDEPMVRRLLRTPGIDVNTTNLLGRTALHVATGSMAPRWNFITAGRREIGRETQALVKLLLDARADAAIRDKYDRNPMQNHGQIGLDLSIFPATTPSEQFAVLAESLHSHQIKWLHRTEENVFFTKTLREETIAKSGNMISWYEIVPMHFEPRETAICLPATFGAQQFFELAARLAIHRKCKVIILDLPGSGRSRIITSGMATLQEACETFKKCSTTEELLELCIQDMTEVLIAGRFGKPPFHLVSSCTGSAIATEWALSRPDLWLSMTFFGWSRCGLLDEQSRLAFRSCLAKGLDAENKYSTSYRGISELLLRHSPQLTDEMLEIMEEALSGNHYDFKTKLWLLPVAMELNFKSVLETEALQVPLLNVTGEYDLSCAEHHQLLKVILPQARSAIMRNSCHYPQLENPTETFSVLSDFWDSVRLNQKKNRAIGEVMALDFVPGAMCQDCSVQCALL